MQLVLACLLYWICCVSAKEIIISEKGSETPSCLEEHDPLVSCQSLVKVSEYVTSHKLNNVTIRINDTNYTLQGVANFSGVENVTITGKGRSLTHINCEISHTHGAGIAFDNSSCITLTNFTISNCGATIVNTNRSHLTGNGTAIQIIDCCQVSVLSIKVYRSISQGLTFINTGSTVRVIDSHFIDNTVSRSQWLGGGALQILFHGTVDLNTNTDYVIANSVFMYNKATTRTLEDHKIFNAKYCERGGGIRIILFDNVGSNSSVTLDNNILEGNTAVFGGGALICVSGSTLNTTIDVLNSNFISNKVLAGGGGIDMGYTTSKKPVYPTNNRISISKSYFINNSASFGGGVSMFVASIGFFSKHARNNFTCTECYFDTNSANGGAAVNIGQDIFKNNGAQFIIWIQFTNSTIVNNIAIFNNNTLSNNVSRGKGASDGSGAFFVSGVDVNFGGTTNFTANNGTALYLDSTTAIFDYYSTVYFVNNSGYQGGAILLFGKSVMYVGDIGSFNFFNNTATKMGGAICALTGGKNVFSYFNTCFLNVYYFHDIPDLSFHFLNNTAIVGDDIFATSIASCNMLCSHRTNPSDVDDTSPFLDHDCYGNFTLSNLKITKSVATSPIDIIVLFQGAVMPGIAAPLDVIQLDEIGGDVSRLFPLTVKSLKHIANVDTVFTNNSITLFGSPEEKGQLLLESSTIRHVINYKLSYCGPGFVFDETKLSCACFNKNYTEIHCKPNITAAIPINYWAGYTSFENDSIATQNNLYTGVCLTELCNPPSEMNCNDDDLLCTLPPSANASILEKKNLWGKQAWTTVWKMCSKYISILSFY